MLPLSVMVYEVHSGSRFLHQTKSQPCVLELYPYILGTNQGETNLGMKDSQMQAQERYLEETAPASESVTIRKKGW